jgi:hypothetical protein
MTTSAADENTVSKIKDGYPLTWPEITVLKNVLDDNIIWYNTYNPKRTDMLGSYYGIEFTSVMR